MSQNRKKSSMKPPDYQEVQQNDSNLSRKRKFDLEQNQK